MFMLPARICSSHTGTRWQTMGIWILHG